MHCWPAHGQAVLQVSAGARHTLLLSASGQLWGCGDASLGQLGPQFSATMLSPCKIDYGAAPWQRGVFVCAAGHHSLAWVGRRPEPSEQGGRLLPCTHAFLLRSRDVLGFWLARKLVCCAPPLVGCPRFMTSNAVHCTPACSLNMQ